MPGFSMPDRNPSATFSPMMGSHFCLRVPDYEAGKAWFMEKLDFRFVVEWPGPVGVRMAYLAAPNDDRCVIEIVGDGDTPPTEVAGTDDLFASLGNGGFHHFCFTVPNVDDAVATLLSRGVTIVTEPFEVAEIGRRLAFFKDPFGNLFELEQKLA